MKRSAANNTPDSSSNKLARKGLGAEAATKLSPGAITSPSTSAYATRKNAGTVELTFNEGLPKGDTTTRRAGGMDVEGEEADVEPRCELEVLGHSGRAAERFMHTSFARRSAEVDGRIEALTAVLAERFSLGELSPAAVAGQDYVRVGGRIVCDAAEGHLNPASVLLEGSVADSRGARVRLDLRLLPEFSLFPGQVVVADGLNTRGDTMVVRRLFTDARLPLPKTPAVDVKRFHHSMLYQGGKALNLWVATGPYTTTDNLDFQPLMDLVAACREAEVPPDVLILCGPFVPANHPAIEEGNILMPRGDGSLVEVTLNELMMLKVSVLLEQIIGTHGEAAELPTRVVLVPSVSDALAAPMYPQPPFIPDLTCRKDRVSFISNPGTIKVNEVVIGVNVQDVLFHMVPEDASRSPPDAPRPDKIGKLVSQLVQQQSYYPLYPGPEGNMLDLEKVKYAHMAESTPDVLILPSSLRCFAKNVDGVLAVNPGYLSRGTGGGTYARIAIHPAKKEWLDSRGDGETLAHEVPLRSRVEIVNI